MMTTILFILFAPDTYLWMMAVPLAVLSLVLFYRWRRPGRLWLRCLALAALLAGWYIFLYGSFVGIRHIEVHQVDYASKDLPEAFDGYRIVHISDAHLGSFNGWRRQILADAVDSINALKADLVVFTGDLQNKVPDEIESNMSLLRRIKATDGVVSVLGNHDYTAYSDRDEFHKSADQGRTCSAEQDMGWFLLTNGYHRIRRGSQCIYIAGMQNDGEGRFPQLGDIAYSLIGLNRQSFVVMLEHDPTSWRRKILPHSHCQLTLSGHTHGGQFSLFGWSPASLTYREYAGMHYAGHRAMYVSTGLGAVIPIRFGVPPEIAVITLKAKK
jgi:predicted MPP superfamily phosphohydrolase